MRPALLALCLLCCVAARGQTFDTEFYPAPDQGDVFAPESDEGIFATPVWSAADPFRDFSRYRFGAVRYRERGLDHRRFAVWLAGVDLTDNLNSYPDWNLITLARRGGLAVRQIPAMVADHQPAALGRAESYDVRPAGDDLYVALRGADRYSRFGGDLRHSHATENGWSWALAATGQGGDDGHIEGLYTDEAGGTAALSKQWRSGVTVTIFGAGGVSDRGSRTAATREAFDLTGDNFYNPVHGPQNGRTRNSRTTRARYFFTAAELRAPLSGDKTLTLTLAARQNTSGRTRLAWYEATSPMPDYYRSMPSFFPGWEAAEGLADAWRTGDPAVTQVDWAALYYINTLSPDGRATYIIEEQVEAARDLHAALTIDRRMGPGLDLSYGARVRRDGSRHYKLAGDMLGAGWVPNTDQYVTDAAAPDGEYHTAPPDENDLRNPGRRVMQGERFGYDYTFTRLVPSAFAIVRWSGPGAGLTASAAITHTRLRREGHYEKGLFPGAASFGPSAGLAFTTGSVSAAGWVDAWPSHSFSAAAIVATEAPAARDIFISPQQNNLIAAGPKPSTVWGAEASWAYTGGTVDLRLGGFINGVAGQTQVRQYYDDLSSRFADMVVRGIDRLGYGVEAGIEARPWRWLTISAGGSVGSFRYNSEPVAELHDDATGEIFAREIVCYMSGLATGLPSRVGAFEVAYSDRRYLRFSISAEWLGGRAVEVNPLFHSSRVTGINPAPEIMARFTSQERLPDVMTLGLSLSKGWVVGRGFLRLAGSVRNLLGASIVHSGYEQMRIRRLGTGLDRTLVPFPPKYLYGWPMTWNVSLSYRL